jgi:hypothetical protein
MLHTGAGSERKEKARLAGFRSRQIDLSVNLRARKEALEDTNGIPRGAHLDPVMLPDEREGLFGSKARACQRGNAIRKSWSTTQVPIGREERNPPLIPCIEVIQKGIPRQIRIGKRHRRLHGERQPPAFFRQGVISYPKKSLDEGVHPGCVPPQLGPGTQHPGGCWLRTKTGSGEGLLFRLVKTKEGGLSALPEIDPRTPSQKRGGARAKEGGLFPADAKAV